MTEQHEVIEVTDKKPSFFARVSRRIEQTGTKTLVVLGIGVAFLLGGGFLLVNAIEDRFEDAREFRYHSTDQFTDEEEIDDTEYNETNSVATTSSSVSVAPVATSELDGTYTATVYNETYTLTIKGNQATLQTSETDGEQEVEQVVFDLEKKVAYVDGEAETYTFDGKILTLTEVDNELFDKDQITFTKK